MIELRGVSKSVPSGSSTLTILHPIDLVVPDGQVVAVTGASGSGKSTLLGLIAGLDAPTSGTITIGGVDITALDEDALARLRGMRIGFVFQFFHLLPSLTALENILVPMEIAGVPGARVRATALLNEVGLSERGHHYPSQLSGGEQQRVAIARALANNPPLLLADEPTGNLDSTTGHQIIELLLDVNRSRGTTLVLVTHDPELAAVADMSIALRDGRVVSQTGVAMRGPDPVALAPDPATGMQHSGSDSGSRTPDPDPVAQHYRSDPGPRIPDLGRRSQ
jgi:putative ABC transport system ATP-binding protein